MSDLFDIQDKLLETIAAASRLERDIAEAGPDARQSLGLMARSLRKRQEALEIEFLEEASFLGVDVCSYRLFGEQRQPTIKIIAETLGYFQHLVSVVYDSIKYATPKERGRVSPSTEVETAFQWGYAFPGSVGIVLTLPNQQNLFGESQLDEAINVIFNMANAKTPEDIHQFARTLGPAPVRAMYNWALAHAGSGLGADIEWRRARLVRASLRAPRLQLDDLKEVITRTSEEAEEAIQVDGTLVGTDIERKTFHLRPDLGEDVRGTVATVVDASHTVELPRRYRARLIKRTKIFFSTEREDITYILIGLEEI